jgi:hypothetical protein
MMTPVNCGPLASSEGMIPAGTPTGRSGRTVA